MTGGRDGEPTGVSAQGCAAPLSISAICATDALVEALSARRSASSADTRGAVPSAGEDPAIGLLQSLIVDVDQGAPPLSDVRPQAPARRPRRRGVRTIVALGVTTAMLTTTGVAAAGGELGGPFEHSVGLGHRPAGPHPDSRAEIENARRSVVESRPDPSQGPLGRADRARRSRVAPSAVSAPRGPDGAAVRRRPVRSEPRPESGGAPDRQVKLPSDVQPPGEQRDERGGRGDRERRIEKGCPAAELPGGDGQLRDGTERPRPC